LQQEWKGFGFDNKQLTSLTSLIVGINLRLELGSLEVDASPARLHPAALILVRATCG
jgi:hypothetical protein